jgi:hypothetical protein
MNSIKQAFEALCTEAKPAARHYVSLYVTIPFYGGPEEGGWWGRDVELVAYQEVTNDLEAEAISTKVREMAEELSKQAKDNFNRACANECEWLEERNLDADYLPEVDGEENYWVATESIPGEHAYQGDRYYS